MVFTPPIVPTLINQQSDSIASTANYIDTHRTMHGRQLTGGVENPRAHGAVGDASTDDTAAFLKAINNQKARGPNGSGRIYVPAGWYVVDGDQIDTALNALTEWCFVGDSPGNTIIQAKTGASKAFGGTGLQHCYFENLRFDGNSKASVAFELKGNSQAHTFINCRFANGSTGMLLSPTGGSDQVDKNTWLGCYTVGNTTGFHANSGNAQCQTWIGGQHSGNDIAVRASLGWYHQIGGMVQQSGGTGYQMDTGTALLLLDDVICEGESISIDIQGIVAPATIHLRNTILQGSTYCVKGATAGSWVLDAFGCRFNTGAIEAGISSVFHDRHNTFGSGAAWVPTTGSQRFQHASNGLFMYQGSTTATRFISPEGYEDWTSMSAPASPAVNNLRLFHNGATSKLSVKDSGGTVTPLY